MSLMQYICSQSDEFWQYLGCPADTGSMAWRYDSAELVITLPAMPSDGKLSAVTASLSLFYADSDTEYPFVSQMDPTFDIQLTKVA